MINLKETANKLQAGGTVIPSGMHENVTLQKVEMGENYIDFFLVDSFGREKKDRVYDPDDKFLTPRPGETKADLLAKLEDDRVRQLLQYILAATDVEIPETVATYVELRKFAVSALDKPIHKLNLKLIPDTKNPQWSAFPKYPPYVERHEEGKPTTLRYSKYELSQLTPKAEQPKEEFKFF